MANKWNEEKLFKSVRNKVLDRLELVGEFVDGSAKYLCPVGTPESTGIKGYIGGNLRDSINHKVLKLELSVKIGTPVEYAPFVELGTSKMAAQPFLRPAVLQNKEAILYILNKR